MRRKKVLIITYLFPPSGGVGVPRFVNYARYLPRQNCEVLVLTARKPCTPVYDPGLAKQVPPETQVFRVFNPEVSYDLRDKIWKRIKPTPSNAALSRRGDQSRLRAAAFEIVRRVCFPDAQAVWVPFAVRAAKSIVSREHVDTILLNAPPFSCLKIAVAIKRSHPHVKLIIDFRDEWLSNYMPDFDVKRTPRTRRMAEDLERAAIDAADFVSGITPSQTRQIRDRYPDQPDSKFITAPNGYDPDLFAGFRTSHPPCGGKMIVTYLGTVYANRVYAPLWRYLETVAELPLELRNSIETRLVGRVAREAEPALDRYRDIVRVMGFFPRAEAVKFLDETDCQLMISSNATSHGGKLFDYLGSGRPILALAPTDGEIAQVLARTRAGWCVDPDDKDGIRNGLGKMLEIKRGNLGFAPDRAAIQEYEWPRLVARMAELTGMSS